MEHQIKISEIEYLDCHDSTLEVLFWDRSTKCLVLEFIDYTKARRVLEMHRVEALMIREFTFSNIILESNIVPALEASQTFWECLFEKNVPTSAQFAERNRLLGKIDNAGFAVSFIGSYGGSIWVLCRSAEWKAK